MKKLIGITAILLGTSNIAQAAINSNPEQHNPSATHLTDTPKTTNPFSTRIEKAQAKSLVSTLEDYLPNENGQKKLNASCN